ncbi:MAG: sugar ABC transporter permease [Clostridiales bacterium]|nr:sugar ABC transporter permease [Clostridiales bacterium]
METNTEGKAKKKRSLGERMWDCRYLYLMSLPAVVFYLLFAYLPMFGITIAFTDYKIGSGVAGFFNSPWNNFENFKVMFESIYFFDILRNTLVISILKLLTGFPLPIIIALMLNEVRSRKFKSIVQGVSYLPHFLSWVVVAAMIYQLLAPTTGAITKILQATFGINIDVFTVPKNFLWMLIISNLWKGTGWGTVVYVAAISSIDPTYYEAAQIDGATKMQRLWFITLPCIVPTIIIVFILNLSSILSAGFDQIFNLYNTMVMSVADIIDTYVYREGMTNSKYGFSTAVGLFKSVISVILIIGSDRLIRKIGHRGIF